MRAQVVLGESHLAPESFGAAVAAVEPILEFVIAVQHHDVIIFINQIRDKIGVMFGSPETTSGGRALKFFSSLRIDIRRISQIKKGDVIIGHNAKIRVIKNKLSAPYRDSEVPLIYGQGLVNPIQKEAK